MRSLALIGLLSIATGSAWSQAAQPAVAPAKARVGYLLAPNVPDVVHIIPPAPTTGDARFKSDMEIFHGTRALRGSPRWALALSDDRVSIAGLFEAFRCALGVLLTPESAPKTTALINKANIDAGGASNLLKNLYQHKRPFQVDDAEVCLTPQGKKALETVPDYPSGHTTAAWEAGLVLAELAPDVAGDILTRARQFGESRVVCGVHNLSAVQAGWLTGTSIFAAQNASADFRSDIEQARAELAALRAKLPVKPQACAEEVRVLSQSPY